MDGVSIYDKNDLYNNSGWDYKDDSADSLYASEVVVKGYCNTEDTPRVLDFLREKFAALTDAGSLNITVNTVEGDAWVETWKKTFTPITTDKLVICPEWQTVNTDKKVLLLDTGIAFGTGQHETTSMCVDYAEQLNLSGCCVLDVGCGSGILGLSALLLGADRAVLVDVDPQATEIAAHNAQINGLTERCDIITGNLTQQVAGKFDVVFANLTADILQLLHDEISCVVNSGTTVVLSGILDVKLRQVTQLYADAFDIVSIASKGEWRAVMLRAK